jgi:hypothetical protein
MLKLLHGDLLQQYNCTQQSTVAQPAQPSDAGGGSAANAGAHPQPHTGSQDNSNCKLLLPQLNHLHLAFKQSQVSPSESSSSQGQQPQQPPKSVIPTQCCVTEQLTKNWLPFRALCQHYTCTRFEEQHQLHLPQQHKAKNSVPNAGLNPLRQDGGCPLQEGTWHGRSGQAPGQCGCAVTSLLQSGCGGAVC